MFLSQLICLIPPTLLWIHNHESNSIFSRRKEPGDSLWDGKYKLRNIEIKLWRERTAFGIRELDLDIDSVLPPSGRDQIIFVTRILFYKKKEKKIKRTWSPRGSCTVWCWMVACINVISPKRLLNFTSGSKSDFFFFNSCISGILGRKDKNWQWNRKKNYVIK